MSRYRVEILPSAQRQLAKLPRDIQQRIGQAIDALAENPRPPGVKKLAGKDAIYRVRVGDYRILYQIKDDELLVLVVKIGHRRDAYRG